MYFVNYYQSKNHKQRYKTKELLYKLSENVNSKHQEELRHRSCAFNCTGEMGMDNSGCLNSSYALFLLCNEPAKKNYGVRTLTAETPPSPQYEPVDFSWTTLPSSKRTYFMDDPQQDHFLIIKQKCICFVLYLFCFA